MPRARQVVHEHLPMNAIDGFVDQQILDLWLNPLGDHEKGSVHNIHEYGAAIVQLLDDAASAFESRVVLPEEVLITIVGYSGSRSETLHGDHCKRDTHRLQTTAELIPNINVTISKNHI